MPQLNSFIDKASPAAAALSTHEVSLTGLVLVAGIPLNGGGLNGLRRSVTCGPTESCAMMATSCALIFVA